MIETGLVES